MPCSGGRASCARSRRLKIARPRARGHRAQRRVAAAPGRRPARHGARHQRQAPARAEDDGDRGHRARRHRRRHARRRGQEHHDHPRRSTSDRPVISADFDRMQQAVWNLLSNAVKFTEPGGRIDVQIAGSGGTVELTVRDTGQGIAPRLPSLSSSTASARPTRRRAGATAASASASRWCGRLSSCTADPSPRAAPAPIAALTFVVRLPVAAASSWPRRAARRAGHA